MHPPLPGSGDARGEKMGVEISRQQRRLEKQQAGHPDRRRSPEPGQNHLGDQRLNFEKQKGGKKYGGRRQKAPKPVPTIV